jgi:steroid delta-isomerase-like uncharacterized protein
MADNQEVTVEMMKDLLEAFNRHDMEAIMDFFAEDCVMDLPRGSSPWGTRYTGKAEVSKGIASRFGGLPDVHYGDDCHWVCGNHGVSEWTLTGTTTAGKWIEVRGCDLWQFQNGKIIRKNSFWKIVE